jgi:nicotinamidase/pyrazinamidase
MVNLQESCIKLTKMKALILIDLQNDFCEGGVMEVSDSDAVLPIANALMSYFDVVVATQNWYPANHGSFAANHLWRKPGQVIDLNGLPQILRIMHCVQNSFGANLHSGLNTEGVSKIIQKGTNAKLNSYSAFFDNGKTQDTGLDAYLKSQNIDTVYIMGLDTESCVKYTALDAISLGYSTFLIENGCRGANFTEGGLETALIQMQTKGVRIVQSDFILNELNLT